MAFADKAGIVVASGFKLQAQAPLDARERVSTLSELTELVNINAAWTGMIVYCEEDGVSYKLIADGTWKAMDVGGSSSIGDTLDSYVKKTGDIMTGQLVVPTVVGDLQGNANTATKLKTPINLSIIGGATGSVSLDGSTDIGIEITIDPSKITGVLPLSAIPKGAIETVTTVTDMTAMYSLTNSDVQNGDVVRVLDDGNGNTIMYYVVDDTNLNSADGYLMFSSGAADSANHADTLTTARKIGITGAVEGTPTLFDGSADINIPVTKVSASSLYVPEGDVLIISANAS